MNHIETIQAALEKIREGAPTWEDFSVGGKYDYDNDCGNSGDIADKAAAEEHLTHSEHAKRAQAALSAHVAEVGELVALAQMIDTHYSGSLDHQPPYVAKARALLAKHKGEV